jgi:hypothetical protein
MIWDFWARSFLKCGGEMILPPHSFLLAWTKPTHEGALLSHMINCINWPWATFSCDGFPSQAGEQTPTWSIDSIYALLMDMISGRGDEFSGRAEWLPGLLSLTSGNCTLPSKRRTNHPYFFWPSRKGLFDDKIRPSQTIQWIFQMFIHGWLGPSSSPNNIFDCEVDRSGSIFSLDKNTGLRRQASRIGFQIIGGR